MKTGYCHIYNRKAPLDSITDRLHIGNRWLGHLGLAMYDNTARVHDPVMPRMLTCDSRAVDYPGHSPFSHCAGNPANISDKDGNKIKLNGNADDINQTLNLLQNSIGNYYSLSCGNDGVVSWEKGNSSVSIVQKKLVEKLTPMLESKHQMELNIESGSEKVLFALANTATIDIADINNIPANEAISPALLLWHEIVEQWAIQQVEPDVSKASEALINSSHLSARNVENLITNAEFDIHPTERRSNKDDTQFIIKYKKPLEEGWRTFSIPILNNNINTAKP